MSAGLVTYTDDEILAYEQDFERRKSAGDNALRRVQRRG